MRGHLLVGFDSGSSQRHRILPQVLEEQALTAEHPLVATQLLYNFELLMLCVARIPVRVDKAMSEATGREHNG